jgi:transposase-like protein
MPRAIPRDAIYRGRRFSVDVIELCVRWYITYRLSYRDLVAMMAERGVTVTHTTIMRWVLRYVPEYEKRWARFARPVGSSWRMDETSVLIRGRAHYLYRAVDRDGRSVDSLLCGERTMEAARAFLRKAVEKTLSLGVYPDVSPECARARHLLARQLLAAGVDPAARREQVRGCAGNISPA